MGAPLAAPALGRANFAKKTHELRGRLPYRPCKSPQILCPSFYRLETPRAAIPAPTGAARGKHPATPRTTSMQTASDPPPNFVGVPPPGENFGQPARAVLGTSRSGPPLGRVIRGIPRPKFREDGTSGLRDVPREEASGGKGRVPGRVPLASGRFARCSGRANKSGAESPGKRESAGKRPGRGGPRGSLAPEISGGGGTTGGTGRVERAAGDGEARSRGRRQPPIRDSPCSTRARPGEGLGAAPARGTREENG